MTHSPRLSVHSPSWRGVGGFTIVEIVVAFLIIGILTAILVPNIASRSEQAKLTAAQADMQNLVDAFERVSIDIGPMVRMDVLDDVRTGNNRNNHDGSDTIDGLSDERIPGGMYREPRRIFISLSSLTYLNDAAQDTLLNQLAPTPSGSAIETDYNAAIRWNGPYLNWMRDGNNNDWPDDPWGNDYLFFSRVGMLSPPDPANPDPRFQEDRSDQFYQIDRYGDSVNSLFDRFTIVSTGPDGLRGNGGTTAYGTGDDLVRQFGGSF